MLSCLVRAFNNKSYRGQERMVGVLHRAVNATKGVERVLLGMDLYHFWGKYRPEHYLLHVQVPVL